jgi:putative copper export protein
LKILLVLLLGHLVNWARKQLSEEQRAMVRRFGRWVGLVVGSLMVFYGVWALLSVRSIPNIEGSPAGTIIFVVLAGGGLAGVVIGLPLALSSAWRLYRGEDF